jgi:hypothetical protein
LKLGCRSQESDSVILRARSGTEESIRILLDVRSKLIKGFLYSFCRIFAAFLECGDDSGENTSCPGATFGHGAKADLSGNDRGSDTISLSKR